MLVYEDVARAIEWLCGAFGFTERLRYCTPDGRVTHAQLSIGEGAVMLGLQGGEFRVPQPSEVNQYVIIHVDDVDAHFERAKRFGATIQGPPSEQPFGERQYTVNDLAGHRWTFSQHIADVAPEEWGASSVNAS